MTQVEVSIHVWEGESTEVLLFLLLLKSECLVADCGISSPLFVLIVLFGENGLDLFEMDKTGSILLLFLSFFDLLC
jgi:hypothetical protein